MDKMPNPEDKGIYREEVASQKSSMISVYLLSWIIFFLISTFNLYEYVLRVSPSVMADEVMFSYQIDATSFGQLSAYFYFIYAPMQIWVGVLMDRYGPHYLLPFAAMICALGTFLFSGAQVVWIAQIGRALMGFGSAFAFVGGLKFLMSRFAAHRFGFLTGLLFSFCLLGGILGQVFLASVLKALGWRAICFGIALFGAILSFLMLISMQAQKNVIPVHEQSNVGWDSVFLGLRSILKNPKIWLMAVIGCLFYLPTSVFAELWGISYLKVGYGFSNIRAAYVVSMMFLGWAMGCPLMGWLSDYLRKPRMLMILGAFFSFILLFIMLLIPNALKAHLPWFMFGLGFFGSSQMLMISMIRHHVALKNASTAIAFLNMFVLMGGFLFQPLIGLLLDKFWQGTVVDGVRLYSGSDYQIALVILPIALLLGIFLSLVFFGKRASSY